MEAVWLTWEHHRRNEGISKALKWQLHEITYERPRILRYFKSIVRTSSLIHQNRPKIVVSQNPSIILAFTAVLLRGIFKYKLVVDAHNSGIFPLEGRSKALMRIASFLQRHADLTIVTNEELAHVVKSNRGKPYILPDRIPEVPHIQHYSLRQGLNVAYICTFSADEPYAEVIKAAEELTPNVRIYITGKHSGKIDAMSVPKNVTLLGFVPENDYWGILCAVDIIMDLTTREGCLVCGAYEGIACGKPLILSETKALKSYFSKGCVYVGPNACAIAEGIREAFRKKQQLKLEVENLKRELEKNWLEKLHDFKQLVQV